MKPRALLLSFAIVGVTSSTLVLHAENWPNWRGPAHNGSSPETGLPDDFSKTEHVLWTAPLPGPAAATPVIWGDHVFISSVDEKKETTVALCLNEKSGKVLWEKEIGSGISHDDHSNYASGSPVTDGSNVYFYYGTGDLVAYDFSGRELWKRNIQKEYGPFAFQWTFSSSPTLYAGKLYLQVLQRDVPVNGRGRPNGPNESYLLALDPATGKELWRQLRLSDNARMESHEAYSTPIPYTTSQGVAQILITGGDCITGHDPATGNELWRWGTWNPMKITHWRTVVSPVAGQDVALACAPKGSPVYAVKLGKNGRLADSDLAWVSKDREVSSDVSTPLFYRDRFYVLNSDRKTLACVDPLKGQVLWEGSLGSRAKLEASPTGADGKIYMMNHRGEVFIVPATDSFQVLRTIAMGEEEDTSDRSTIAVADGRLFIRTATKLYCVGKE